MELDSPIVTAAAFEQQKRWQLTKLALQQRHPPVLLEQLDLDPEVEWVYARDGSAWARTRDGKWQGDCSVPLLAAVALLKTLEPTSQSCCLLAPVTAGLLVAARQQVGPAAVIVVVQPDARLLRILLGCADVADDIRSGHLWFASGDDWAGQLAEIYREHPGLATPVRFIKTKLLGDDAAGELITTAQQAFSDTLANRAREIKQLSILPRAGQSRWLVVAGSKFSMWNAAGKMAGVVGAASMRLEAPPIQRFDTDDPFNTSPLALARAAVNCTAVVAANLFRGDANFELRPEVRWITWLTQPVVPAASACAENDVLILADERWQNLAVHAGWPAHRVLVGDWPQRHLPAGETSQAIIGLFVDTAVIKLPEAIADFSSQRVLWEMLEEELRDQPLLATDAVVYLQDRAQRLNVQLSPMAVDCFLNALIMPAMHQGLARLLLQAGLSVALFGSGWTEMPEFAVASRGKVEDDRNFDHWAASCSVLVHVWPNDTVHPVETLGKPLLKIKNVDRGDWLKEAANMLSHRPVKSATHLVGKTSLQKAIQLLAKCDMKTISAAA